MASVNGVVRSVVSGLDDGQAEYWKEKTMSALGEDFRTAISYLVNLLRHKWFVLVAGLSLGVPLWRLLKHDWTKFLPSEFMAYARHFHGSPPSPDLDFDLAWLKHKNRNDHHWEYWTGPDGTLRMSEGAVLEMVADWLAAGRTYEGRWPDLFNYTWFNANRGRMILHPGTRYDIYTILTKAQLIWKQ
jgi:hypothetical protein